jgi:hypothetical protein
MAALAVFDDRSSARILESMLPSETDLSLLPEIVRSLAAIGDDATRDALLAFLMIAEDESLRSDVEEALEEFARRTTR